MCSGKRSLPDCLPLSAFTRRWGADGSREWRGRSMLFKPDLKEPTKHRVRRVASGARRRTVSILITLLIVGGLGYIGWTASQQKQASNRTRFDLPVPVLAATPRIQDVPVYLDGVGAVRALNTV